MDSVWVLSMCLVSEGGGEAIPAEIYATKEDAENAERRYARADSNWGCVDWVINQVDISHLKEAPND